MTSRINKKQSFARTSYRLFIFFFLISINFLSLTAEALSADEKMREEDIDEEPQKKIRVVSAFSTLMTPDVVLRDILYSYRTRDLLVKTSPSTIKTRSRKLPKGPRPQSVPLMTLNAEPIGGGPRPESVFLPDERRRVSPTDVWPYSVHGVVAVRFSGGGGLHQGTGTLIGPNIVLTAAHNFYSDRERLDKAQFAESVQFIPAMNGQLCPFLSHKVGKERLRVPDDYGGYGKEDYALIFLETSVGETTGYYGLAVLDPEELKTKKINVTGYPGDKILDKPGLHEMWEMGGEASSVGKDLIGYTISTNSGQSGGGVWYREGDNCFVVGVHVLGDNLVNQATLMTKERCERIQGWVQEYTKTEVQSLAIIRLKEKIRGLNLTSLDIRDSKVIDSGIFRNIAEVCPSLEYLDVSGCSKLTHIAEEKFGIFGLFSNLTPIQMPCLQRLLTNRCKILQGLLMKAPRLLSLEANQCQRLTTLEIDAPELQRVSLEQCSTLNMRALAAIKCILDHSPKLKFIRHTELNTSLEEIALIEKIFSKDLDTSNHSKIYQILRADFYKNSAEELLNRGWQYANEKGLPSDYRKACIFYLLSQLKNQVSIMHNNIGFMYQFCGAFGEEFVEKALQHYSTGSDLSEPYATYALGFMIDNGVGVVRDQEKSNSLYRKAHELGHDGASYYLCVSKIFDEKDSQRVLSRLADRGYLMAFVEKSPSYTVIEKERWDLSNTTRLSFCNLGWVYENGVFGEKDLKKAYELYKKAAWQGDLVAQYFYRKNFYKHSHEQMMNWHQRFSGMKELKEELALMKTELRILKAGRVEEEEEEEKHPGPDRVRGLVIPEIARGYEDIYRRFLKGALVYRPTPGSDAGKIELPIGALEGTFDLSRCGDTGNYLSIATGYRKGKNPQNKDKVEIWIAPRFMIEKELATSAGKFKDIMGKWTEKAPVGLFWTWGNWESGEASMDYLTDNSFEQLGEEDLLKKYWAVHGRGRGEGVRRGVERAAGGGAHSCFVLQLSKD